jgi:hypothetical protein
MATQVGGAWSGSVYRRGDHQRESFRADFFAKRRLIDRLAGLFGEFEANGTARFLLADGSAFHSVAMGRDILDFEAHYIAAAELAVNRKVEQCEVADLALHLQPRPDCPNMLGLQWRFGYGNNLSAPADFNINMLTGEVKDLEAEVKNLTAEINALEGGPAHSFIPRFPRTSALQVRGQSADRYHFLYRLSG